MIQRNLEKLQRDVDLRFADLANRQPAPAVSPMAAEPATAPKDGKEAATSPAGSDAGADKSEDDPAPNANGEFATPREHYNYAFRLLNQTKYKEAADSFAQFTKKHPKDALVGNAYYWQGETHYIRRDYGNAADMFRQGFEAMPDGPKAADNLLKLAMSLSALKREKEACVVLEQLATKFTKSSKNIANRAVQEQKRIGCGA
jgi:tol-pal system protein YbgF